MAAALPADCDTTLRAAAGYEEDLQMLTMRPSRAPRGRLRPPTMRRHGFVCGQHCPLGIECAAAQESGFRVNVDMVLLTSNVLDTQERFLCGLNPRSRRPVPRKIRQCLLGMRWSSRNRILARGNSGSEMSNRVNPQRSASAVRQDGIVIIPASNHPTKPAPIRYTVSIQPTGA
jgi:hypothetical protein